MTGNTDLILWCLWLYLTDSGRGDQTAHNGDKTADISHLVQLLLPILDSRNAVTAAALQLKWNV